MFQIRKASYFYSKEENKEILNTIRENEKNTSGEIRVYIESHCAYVEPFERARELFLKLKMFKTLHRNAVLIYIAYLDKEFAFCSDENLFKKTKQSFWDSLRNHLIKDFTNGHKKEGIIRCINLIGSELEKHFPFHGENKNELPDEIIFGK
ncbi:MAG TPA: TPM domain-containing protein [Chitinophagaceae bacterium]|nr:MAG: hypothetical protein UZ11_BCD004000918 [Bacteroidetes bacterium OLB11]HMN32824.1 TPM domain-containing protein [Chitinophagaceae bacterium]